MSGESNGVGTGRKRRRVWCETLPLDELARGPALSWLGARGIDPVIAVRPGDAIGDVAHAISRARDLGLTPALWPMLDDARGRWCGAANVETFAAFAEGRLAALVEAGGTPAELAVDLEPPIAAVRAAFPVRPGARAPRGAERIYAPLWSPVDLAPAAARLRRLVGHAASHGVISWAAAPPPVLFDSNRRHGWQRLLGTPIDGIPWAAVSPMLYTSLFAGWSSGVIDRAGARGLLSQACRRTIARFGDAAAASLGCVGTGALGDEPTYLGVAELVDDVGLARAAGIEDLALFDLGGAMRRAGGRGEPPAEAWLDALVETPPTTERPPRAPFALRAALGVAALGGRFS